MHHVKSLVVVSLLLPFPLTDSFYPNPPIQGRHRLHQSDAVSLLVTPRRDLLCLSGESSLGRLTKARKALTQQVAASPGSRMAMSAKSCCRFLATILAVGAFVGVAPAAAAAGSSIAAAGRGGLGKGVAVASYCYAFLRYIFTPVLAPFVDKTDARFTFKTRQDTGMISLYLLLGAVVLFQVNLLLLLIFL